MRDRCVINTRLIDVNAVMSIMSSLDGPFAACCIHERFQNTEHIARRCNLSPEITIAREETNMSQVRKMLLGTVFAAIASSAFAQTPQPSAADATGQIPAPAAPAAQLAPPPQNLVAPAPTDPFVQKRNANARANAEYRASKKASKQEMNATSKEAKAQYKEQVRNAKINQKADKQTANDDFKAAEPSTPKDTGVQH
jgi:hypothetical protein